MSRGWKGNALGLQRWEVLSAHEARLHATEAVADLVRKGKSFDAAKAEIVRRARSVYKHSRPELYQGYIRCVSDVRFSDMPADIIESMQSGFLASIETARGYKAGRVERLLYRLTGLTF